MLMADASIDRPARRLDLESCANFRDLGGYLTGDGGETAWGKIYRADALAELTEADMARLDALPLRVACDLRSIRELTRHPNVFAERDTVAYHHLAVALPSDDDANTSARDPNRNFVVYQHMLDHSGATFRALFERLSAAESYPIVFHCTAGKDRTGVVAAVLLLIAGVDRGTVFADYLHTADYANELGERLARLFGQPRYDPERFPIEVHPEAMAAVLDRIEGHYGGAEGYLARAGVTAAQVTAFRREFVVRPAARPAG